MIQLNQTTSTNDEAFALINSGQASDGLVVWALEQTKGRGRRGRVWISPPGNLHCTMIWDITAHRANAAQLGFVAAIALVDALQHLVPGTKFYGKWPNDVLAEDRKVAGMLLEAHGANWLVLGLGVDVLHAPPPEMVDRPAASLASLGYGGDAGAVLTAFYQRMVPLVQSWREQGFAPIREAWLQRAFGKGGPVTVRLEDQSFGGLFEDLDQDGALILTGNDGQRRRVLAGDVYMGGLGASGH